MGTAAVGLQNIFDGDKTGNLYQFLYNYLCFGTGMFVLNMMCLSTPDNTFLF